MNVGLAGKTAIVTGATSNIGRAIALAMAAEGVNLVVVGRDVEAGERVVHQAMEVGANRALFKAADLLVPSSGEEVAKAALDEFGAIDVLVNNVGGNAQMGFFADSNPSLWQADIDISLMTVLRVTHAALPHMIARKGGRIINIGSTAGQVGDYMLSVYSTAKAAVHGFTKVLAKEVGQHGITVNCVAPYVTFPDDEDAMSSGSRFHPETGFFTNALKNLSQEDLGRLTRSGPLPRTAATASEVAAGVIYLASEQAAFVTGQIHYIEGGTLL
jgi:2-hydroxycyclohexanecarboxyl-CoA dehydrogenase